MSKYKFQKGDRVVVVRTYENDIKKGIQIGDTGEVLEDSHTPFVRMDKFNEELHEAGGLCEHGHGKAFQEHQLKLELDPQSEVSNDEVTGFKFKKGDRVVVARPDEDDIRLGIQIGDAGEVLENHKLPYVRMDKFNKNLGDADGKCENGHGRPIRQDQLELEPKSEVSNEEVNSPNHYNASSVEVWEMMLAIWGKEKFIAFCEMNAFKYRMRMGLKDTKSPLVDLDKAKWYEGKVKELRNENTEEE